MVDADAVSENQTRAHAAAGDRQPIAEAVGDLGSSVPASTAIQPRHPVQRQRTRVQRTVHDSRSARIVVGVLPVGQARQRRCDTAEHTQPDPYRRRPTTSPAPRATTARSSRQPVACWFRNQNDLPQQVIPTTPGARGLRWLTRPDAPTRLAVIGAGEVHMDVVRTYAKVAGVVIVLIGVAGLVLGEKSLGGVLNIDIAEDIIHLLTGGLMAAVGFRGSDGAVRSVVGGLGVVYLLIGVLGIFVPDLFGLLPSEYETVLDNLIHLTLGVLGIVVGFVIGGRSGSRLTR